MVDRFVPPDLVIGEYRLRRFRREDADPWYEYLSDPRVTEHTSWPPITREFVASVVEKVINDYDELASLRWALARQVDDRLVGSCGYPRWFRRRARRTCVISLCTCGALTYVGSAAAELRRHAA